MCDFFKLKTWIITALMFILAVVLSSAIVYFESAFSRNIKPANASSANNVSGYAWNANAGWISFNCTNDSPACADSNYGVNVDPATGNISGYAWSASAGWICLGDACQSAVYQNFKVCSNNKDIICADSSVCGGQPCDYWRPATDPDGQPTAVNYSFADQEVAGWANILSLGNGGWIKFNGNKQDGQPWTPGVSIDLASGEFSGWAWNASNDGSGMGWISFNCSNESPACNGTNYKVIGVINRPPAAANLTAPNWNYVDAGGVLGALNANLDWVFTDSDSDSSESAYRIVFNDKNDLANPIFDSGKCTGYLTPSDLCKIDIGVDNYPAQPQANLNYNTPYYWWVQVWDNHDAASALAQYDTIPDTDNDDGVATTFTTYKHEMPDPSFSYFPVNPSKGEKVKFTDTSKIYLSADPARAVNCSDALCDWAWSATAGATFKDNDIATSTPTITFNSAGNSTVTLTVTDNDGYRASVSAIINVNAKLPKWKEVKPE